MNSSQTLLARLRAGDILLADGATGTLLQAMGLEGGRVPESWTLDRPECVRDLHRQYVEAGANLILTNTFGGTRFRLQSGGLAEQAHEVNRRAADLAREAAGSQVWVAGDMGPTGLLLAPLGPLSTEEVAEAYAEQAAGLAAGGADLLVIETMSDLCEARAAIEGARRAADLPIFCTFSFDVHRRTMMGVRPAQVAREIGPLVAGFGANCGREPAEFVSLIEEMRHAAPEAILWAKPNAGLPRLGDDDRVVYDATPQYMAEIAADLAAAGAQIIGGCCGTTPAHIAAMARALKGDPIWRHHDR